MANSVTQRKLKSIGACEAAIKWAGRRSWARAWAECPRGDWLLWLLQTSGTDCSAVGFWCAERARQHALRALPPSPQRDVLERCAPIVDKETAAAVAPAAWAAARAAWAGRAAAAAEAAERAEAEALATAAAGRAATAAVAWASEESRTTARYVRARYKCPAAPKYARL